MKIQYDPKVDAMYIELLDGKYYASREISASVIVDEDEKGKLLGIEILDASTTIKNFNPDNIHISVQSSQ